MRGMKRISRNSGTQHLHRQTERYRTAVRRKLSAYDRHIQIGLIAQGLLQYLSATHAQLVWSSFGSWLRTIRPGVCPSELVTATAQTRKSRVEIGHGTEHEDGCPETRFAHGSGDLQPVAAGQHAVQRNDVEVTAQSHPQALRAIDAALRQQAVRCETGCDGSGHFNVIFNDQDPGLMPRGGVGWQQITSQTFHGS